jgi:anti-sigma regulatory factor (Ser/Thr protein kinase)
LTVRGEVPNGPDAPARARRLIDDSLFGRVPDSLLEDLRLVASELVTNSYKHAGNPEGHPIEVSVDLTQNRVRLEVIDRSIFDPTPETTEELRSERWGLLLVDRIARGWGRISEGGIWAEFSLPP